MLPLLLMMAACATFPARQGAPSGATTPESSSSLPPGTVLEEILASDQSLEPKAPEEPKGGEIAEALSSEGPDEDLDEEKAESEELARLSKLVGEQPAPAPHKVVPLEINRRVVKWLQYFAFEDHERFQRFLDRGERYHPMVRSVLKSHDMPAELYYLGMIESGYATHATSRASAVGIWQFMRGTGRQYGLKLDRYTDERRHPLASTHAAAKYLKTLYKAFKSWYLALAAYNAGEGRIARGIRRAGSRDYWELVERRVLPAETIDYIPKFIAATIIGRHPEKYGFKVAPASDAYPEVARVKVPGGVRLDRVARSAGVSSKVLQDLNPQLRRGITSPYRASAHIWVPQHLSARFSRARTFRDVSPLRRLLARDSQRERMVERVAAARRFYRVRGGDTLHGIAARFELPVSQIKRMNRLRRNLIFVGQRLRLPAG